MRRGLTRASPHLGDQQRCLETAERRSLAGVDDRRLREECEWDVRVVSSLGQEVEEARICHLHWVKGHVSK